MSIKVTKLNHIYDKGMPTEQKALTDVRSSGVVTEIIE